MYKWLHAPVLYDMDVQLCAIVWFEYNYFSMPYLWSIQSSKEMQHSKPQLLCILTLNCSLFV